MATASSERVELALVDKIAQRMFEGRLFMESGTWARLSEVEREKWRAAARKQLAKMDA